MILVDDADRKLFSYIPRIKAAIADKGATAPNFLLNHPVCGPSRATLLRGQYEHNTGVTKNGDAYSAWVSLGGENANLATWLHAAGYKTALVGKYLNGYGETDHPPTWVPPGWDFWFGLFHDAGDSYDYDANDNGTIVHYGHQRSDFATDVLTGKALQFLNSEMAASPFFLLVSTKAPHAPAIPAPEYEHDFAGVTYPRGASNPSFNEDDVRDKPFYVSKEKKLDSRDVALIDESYRQRLRSMESVEDMVDALISALGSRLSNTYVIFTSDNGFHMGEHRLGHGKFPGGKNTPYEEDIALPLWIRGPGITPGRQVNELLGNVDIAPTICQMAGVTPGINVDGRSFLPLVQGTTIPWRNKYLIQRSDGGKSFAGIRSKDKYLYTELDDPDWGEVKGEYYNLNTDPFELTNGFNGLSGTTKATLHNRLNAYRVCAGNSCRVADSS
jgi:arylsulfatase A-like enzyme